MRVLATSFAILLALVAFGPTQTMAKDPGGGPGKGHSSSGHPSSGHPSVGQPTVGHPSVGQRVTGSTETHHEAGPNLSKPGDAGRNAHQSAGVHVNPQFPVGAGAAATPIVGAIVRRTGAGGTGLRRTVGCGMAMTAAGWTIPIPPRCTPLSTPVLVSPLPEANFSGGAITITNPATNNVTLSYTLDGTAYTIPPGYSQELREDRAWVIQFSRGANLGQAEYGLQSGLYSFTSTDHGWELYRSELPTSQ